MFLFYIVGLAALNLKIIQATPKYDYQEVLEKSLLFYQAQRSGKLPDDQKVTWRKDSALNDKGINGEDLTGGYYDAGDFVKFGFPMAFTTTILSWGLISFRHGYVTSQQYDEALRAVKWGTDYFLKAHVSPNELYGQVGDITSDHAYWGRPENMTMPRPAYKIDTENPGSDLAGQTSAALASASLLFRDVNASYADDLVRHADELFKFGSTYKGLYNEAIPGAKIFYESTGYGDKLVWAAVWLYKATKDVKYLEEAEGLYKYFKIKDRPNEFSPNKLIAGIQLLLAQETSRNDYLESVKDYCDFAMTKQLRTPKGLLYIEKAGTLALAANSAFICLLAARSLNISRPAYVDFAQQQIDYILGDGGRSYVVGFGRNYPTQPHHAASSCPELTRVCSWEHYYAKSPNPQILYGALVSGPDQNDYFEDNRQEFLFTEVRVEFNAGFQSAVAGLV